jgi:hypothetical protein
MNNFTITPEMIYGLCGLILFGRGMWMMYTGRIAIRNRSRYDMRIRLDWTPTYEWSLEGSIVTYLGWLHVITGSLICFSWFQEYQKIHPNMLDALQTVIRSLDARALEKNSLWGIVFIAFLLAGVVPSLLIAFFGEKNRID